MSWVILEYVNEAGQGAVSEWLDSLAPGVREDAKAALDATLQLMQPVEHLTRREHVGKLENKLGARGRGLYEIQFKAAKTQWRPLFCYLPKRRIVILAGAVERGSRLEPKGACDRAHRRAAQLNQPRRLRAYGYK